ncbi:hypothetical protein CKO44_23090 [Rubrivivax gelatinosus]|uniref:NapC/NirT family cytochrome c n=1 Tax=Rubrivivax gelatinosus TaxID=28068 RepID=UPI001908A77E|nr:NapC/NirT family cytochrome c [Rubrivivax gelatinosus]MBK1616335.1 hypothetical protein [Rubrivivax gelatinosus]
MARASGRFRSRWPWAVLLLGLVLGALAFAGGSFALQRVETNAFCTSCHTMQTPLAEMKLSLHHGNRSGVAAQCADCHVPPDTAGRLLRHLQGARELWHEQQGTISTPEKFEARRLLMATREWDRMQAGGSAECRRCHAFEAMAPDVQKKSAYAKHQRAQAEGKSCIACHKGIAHDLPRDWQDPEDAAAARVPPASPAG